MTADPMLALDLGKYKCVACVFHRATASAERPGSPARPAR
jgi:hypothetical protein